MTNFFHRGIGFSLVWMKECGECGADLSDGLYFPRTEVKEDEYGISVEGYCKDCGHRIASAGHEKTTTEQIPYILERLKSIDRKLEQLLEDK